MDDVQCTGEESSLANCDYLGRCGIRSCSTSDQAAVRCYLSKFKLRNQNKGMHRTSLNMYSHHATLYLSFNVAASSYKAVGQKLTTYSVLLT